MDIYYTVYESNTDNKIIYMWFKTFSLQSAFTLSLAYKDCLEPEYSYSSLRNTEYDKPPNLKDNEQWLSIYQLRRLPEYKKFIK